MVDKLRTIYENVPNCTYIEEVRVVESYATPIDQAVITCYETTLSIGNSISFNIGYEDDNGKVFTGYVRNIEKKLPDNKTRIICENELSKATDYFIATDNPTEPYRYANIKSEDFVEQILALASITNYTSNVPLEFRWGTNGAVEINLVNAWNVVNTLAGMLAWHIYADRDGKVHFVDRKPYWESGDSSSFTWNQSTENILMINHTQSTEGLRNRVVAYGKNNISATAKTSSPYLPAGFYKTAVLATPILDTTSLCQTAANYNLDLYNRLTESLTIQITGDWNVKPRLFATITESFTGVDGNWFIYQVEHNLGKEGYVQNVTLTK
ncbi:MAG: hypothetical protein ACTSO3_17040 [Candidatus Heimdallarchaeaceae archaeon]